MRKHLLTATFLKLLVLVTVFTSSSLFSYAQEITSFDFEVDNIPYKILNKTSVSVVKDDYTDPKVRYAGDIIIPDEVEYDGTTYQVTEIGTEAFAMAEEMTSIHIGANIKTIGMVAFFNCKKLSEITIPANVRTIYHAAFMTCSGLSEITIEEGVRTIYGGCFSGCGFETIKLPASLTTVENGIIASCPNLKKIEVAEGNTILKADDNGILYNISGNTIMQYPAGRNTKEYTIPEEVTTLYESSFEGANYITKLTLPTTLKTIQDAVFVGCQNLTDIICESTTPISLSNESVFDPLTFNKCILRVPDEAVTSYKEASVWNKFTEIMGFSDIDIESLVIDPSSVKILRNNTYQLKLTVLPENSTYKNVIWSTENPEVAEVDQTGLVTAVEVGDVLISCATPSGQIRGYCHVTVYDEYGAVDEIDTTRNIHVFRTENGILITGCEGLTADVFNAAGCKVYSGTETIVNLPKGIYIVNVNGKTFKVSL